MFAVDVSHLEKFFHRRRGRRRRAVAALSEVSFAIALDECVAILGQNGSGKLEKGAQLGFIAQGFLLVVSVFTTRSPCFRTGCSGWPKSHPATYALRGTRAAILDGSGLDARWADIWPLLVLGAVAIPLGLVVVRAGERYAKRHGKLKRSG